MKFERMKDIREDRDLTQKQLASILDVERSTYAGWETGKNTIPLKKLSTLSDYYKLSIDYTTGLSNTKSYDIINKIINKKDVGKNLKKIRVKNNLKQRGIFTFLNTTSSTYSAYETGKVLIQTSFIYSIAKKYNVSIDWILNKAKDSSGKINDNS